MTQSASEWLRATMRDPWWRLTADQFRIAMTLVALADVRDGAPRVTAPSSDFERYFGMTRGKIRRALDALEKAGFCQVWAAKGKGGVTSIVLRDARPFKIQLALPLPIIQNDVQDAEMLCVSSADHGERGHSTDHSADHSESSKSADLSQMIGEGRARDQDLLRSPRDQDLGSDLRSPDSQDLTSNLIQKSPLAGMAGWVDPSLGSPDGDATVRSRLDPEKIPDRAWAAADYLRAQVLAENRAAFVGTKPWESGWEFPATGKSTRVGDGSRVGLRLSWAHAFRLLNGKVVAAMKNANGTATEADAWAEIARTVRWLFHDQPVEPRFVVASPDSLIEKWDNIQRNRANRARADAQPKPVRDGSGRPVDPATQHTFRRLGGQ